MLTAIHCLLTLFTHTTHKHWLNGHSAGEPGLSDCLRDPDGKLKHISV